MERLTHFLRYSTCRPNILRKALEKYSSAEGCLREDGKAGTLKHGDLQLTIRSEIDCRALSIHPEQVYEVLAARPIYSDGYQNRASCMSSNHDVLR